MLTVIHTADWHTGQNFYGYDRTAEHLAFFDWLKRQVREHNADVLLVAGDIFDSPNPSADAQKTYYRFLHEISTENKGLQTVIIAGNHDSAARLEAPNPLLEEMNITVRGIIRRTAEGDIDYRNLLIPLEKNGQILAWCIAVPFLRQGDYPPSENYAESVRLMYRALYDELAKVRTPGQAVVVMGHLQAGDAILSGDDRSERTVTGGLECVPTEIFGNQNTGYVALGHLHRHQTVAGHTNIQYAGSPLPMSFAEKNYGQGVNLVRFDRDAVEKIERIRFDPPAKLISLPSEPLPLDDVLICIGKLPDGEVTAQSPYLEINVLLTEPQPSIRYRIEEALKGKAVRLACTISHRPATEKKETKTVEYGDLQKINPMEIAKIAYRNQYNSEMPDNIANLLNNVIRELETMKKE